MKPLKFLYIRLIVEIGIESRRGGGGGGSPLMIYPELTPRIFHVYEVPLPS